MADDPPQNPVPNPEPPPPPDPVVLQLEAMIDAVLAYLAAGRFVSAEQSTQALRAFVRSMPRSFKVEKSR